MAGMKGKGPKQSSPVAGSSKDQYGPDKQPDGDSDDADSAVCSEASMPRDINFSGTQPHNESDDDSAVSSVDSMPRGADFSYTQQHQKCTVVPPELRVMMLGKTGTGKSASGNTILGREAFKSEASPLPVTKSCDTQSGVVEGRSITVIDTPAITTGKAAWLSEKVDPGPHVFLLVIPLGRFTEEDGEEVKWIQSNFGEEALKFTIILFTAGDQLKGKALEDFLQESPKLQSVLDGVGGRYHLFNNSLPTDRNQVKGLIKKIENALIEKLGYVYTHEEQEKVKTAVRQEYEREKENAERTRIQELEKVKTAVRQEYEREKENAERTKNQEEKNMRDNQAHHSGTSWKLLMFLNILMFHCCYCPEDPVELPGLRVMMLGKTGTGKSASGNTILGREAFKSKASALPVTKYCDSQSGVVEGRNITVIDTPATTTRKTAWLSEKIDPGTHVFLLVIRLGRFTEEDGQEVKWIQRNFGEEALKFTIVLFTGGDQMDEINAEQFLNESSGLHTLVSSTGGGYHIFDNKTPRGHGQVKGLLEKIEQLLRKNTGYSYSDGLHEQVTTAVREEEERKRRKEEEDRKRLEMEGCIQVNEVIKTMEKRIEGEMELKMMTRMANATATLNELREVVKATTDQSVSCKQEQVKAAVREKAERKRREKEEEEKEEATKEQVKTALREERKRRKEEQKFGDYINGFIVLVVGLILGSVLGDIVKNRIYLLVLELKRSM